MPGSQTHQYLTKIALSLAAPEKDCGKLIEEYCLYPDIYFGHPKDLSPYFFSTDGVQFHYLPDTPYNELYRYWETGPDGHLRRVKPYRNENFRHAKNGFSHYLTKAVECLRVGEEEEGKKFLGCLLHMLEDSAFGIHSIEGPGGVDIYALDRLSNSPLTPTDILKKLSCAGLPAPVYRPRLLGDSVEEAVMRLYATYVRAVSDSRKCCFQIVVNTLNENEEANPSLLQRMFENAVKLCADTAATVFSLAEERVHAEKIRLLTELEPYEFPLGGFGPYAFRTHQIDFAYDLNGKQIPLKLTGKNGVLEFRHGISFGTHFEGNLLYWLAPGTFRSFSCSLGIHPEGAAEGEVRMEVISNGAVVAACALDRTTPAVDVAVPYPENDFGFRMRCKKLCGIIVIGKPFFS